MTRAVFRLLAACGLTVVMAAAPQDPSSQNSEFRSGTHTVSIYATVIGPDGRLVTDLPQSSFEVFDNGVPQPLTVFANEVQPITIVVMLDRSASMSEKFGLVRDAARAFVEQLEAGDKARVGSFSTRIEIHPADFTGDRAVLGEVLRRRLQDPGPTPLWKATAAAMDALAEEDGRRVVLVFTDGKDTPDLNATIGYDDVRTRAQVEEVMVYAIGLSTEHCTFATPAPLPGRVWYQWGGRRPGGGQMPGGPYGGIPRPRFPRVTPPPPRVPPVVGRPGSDSAPCFKSAPDPELRELADEVGGGYFELDEDDDHLAATFARVADELHHQYVLAFTAPVLDGTMHSIDVRVSDPQLTVRARKSYMASPR